MNETERLLGALRDIHLPPAPEGVSLWLIGANFIVVTLVIVALLVSRKRRKNRWRHQALTQIEHARRIDPQPGLLLLARTLRQLVLARADEAVIKHDQRWLDQLNQVFNTRWFTEAEGRIFGSALYTKTACDADVAALGLQLQRLVKRLPTAPSSSSNPALAVKKLSAKSDTASGPSYRAGTGSSRS